MSKVLNYLNLVLSAFVLFIEANLASYILKLQQVPNTFQNPRPSGLANVTLYLGGLFQLPIMIASGIFLLIGIMLYAKNKNNLNLIISILWGTSLALGIYIALI